VTRVGWRWLLPAAAAALAVAASFLAGLYRWEQRDPFCIACHLHEEKYGRFAPASGPPGDLAAAHGAAGIRCIGCHGGADAWARAKIWAVAARDTAKFLAGRYREPDHMTLPLTDADCRWCHRAMDDPARPARPAAWFHTLVHAGLPAKSACVDCHQAHPPASKERRFTHAAVVLPACYKCHPPGPTLRSLPIFREPSS
jgi:NapC/NirT cytochrome c family protein